MKEQVGKTDGEHFASHWLTIQPSLFNFIEDEVGELDENQSLFVRLAESVELGRIAAKYGWRGNGRKPSSRLAMFKLLLVKHVWNFPTTKDALAEVRHAPSMRRLCGWESQSDIPSDSTMSRAFGDFAADGTASSLFADFVKKVTKGRNLDTNLSLLPTLPFLAFPSVHFPLPFGKEVRLDCQPMARKPRFCAFPSLVVHVSAPCRTRFVILAHKTRAHQLQDLAPARSCSCLSYLPLRFISFLRTSQAIHS